MVEWIVSGFEAIALAAGSAVWSMFEAIALAGSTAGDAVVGSFGNVGQSLLGVAFVINNAILTIAGSAGPASPFVVVLLYCGITLVLVGLFVALRKGVLWLT